MQVESNTRQSENMMGGIVRWVVAACIAVCYFGYKSANQPHTHIKQTPVAVTTKPDATTKHISSPNPQARALIVDMFGLLGKTRSEAKRMLGKYKMIERERASSVEAYGPIFQGGEFLTYSLGGDKIICVGILENDVVYDARVEGLDDLKLPLEQAPHLMARLGAGSLDAPYRTFPRAWYWQDTTTGKTKYVTTVADEHGSIYQVMVSYDKPKLLR